LLLDSRLRGNDSQTRFGDSYPVPYTLGRLLSWSPAHALAHCNRPSTPRLDAR